MERIDRTLFHARTNGARLCIVGQWFRPEIDVSIRRDCNKLEQLFTMSFFALFARILGAHSSKDAASQSHAQVRIMHDDASVVAALGRMRHKIA